MDDFIKHPISLVDRDPWGLGHLLDAPPAFGPPLTSQMKIDVVEYDNNFKVEVDVPGVPKENIKIVYDNSRDVMTISTTASSERSRVDENTGKVHYYERFGGTSSRTISFRNGAVNHDGITASHTDGVLSINIPKFSPNEVNSSHSNIKID